MKFPHTVDLGREAREPYTRRNFHEQIETEVELAGTPRSSALFPLKVVAQKVKLCQERQQFPDCAPCVQNGNCELAAQHARNLTSLPQMRAAEAAQPQQENVWLNLNVDSLPESSSS